MLVVLALLAGCGGTAASGETCEQTDDCIDGGTCLKGVCSGYACAVDADCIEGQECGDFSGVRVCAIPCAGEADECPGTMSCQAFEGADTGASELYCL